MSINEISTTITGTEGKETLRGTFKFKVRLSYRDVLAMDDRRRRYMGANAEYADQAVLQVAYMFAKIQTHLMESPSWWKEADNGMNLEPGPDSVVNKLFLAILEEEKKASDALTTEAEKAKGELKAP